MVNLDEVIAKAKVDFLAQAKWPDNAGCLFIKPNGSYKGYSGHVCHANLRHGYGSKVVLNGLMDGTSYGSNPGRILAPEIELWFVDYILNRSPYSQIFIEKDAKSALETRITVASGDHPANLLAAGLVALRRLWEYVYVAKAAYDLAQQGVNEDLAYFLGHLVSTENNAQPASLASWTACTAGHCSLDPCAWAFPQLKNFLEHKVVEPKANYSDPACDSYCGYDAMYGTNYANGVLKYIRSKYPKHLHNGEVKVSTNPFQAALKQEKNENQTTYARAIEVMAVWAKTDLMEKIYA